MVLDDKDVFAALKKAAKAEDPDKISQISREGSQEIKWRRLTQDVRTPQLILQVMTDEKVTGDVAKTMQAIAKTLTAKQQPINEDDGEIINMRTATIAAMVKAGVELAFEAMDKGFAALAPVEHLPVELRPHRQSSGRPHNSCTTPDALT